MDNTTPNILLNFVSAAEKSRKYPPATAYNIRSALKLINPLLTDEEEHSIDLFEKNIDQIFHSYYQKNQTKMSAGSLETYKARIKKVIEEYKKYGQEPSKMANWNPVIKLRRSKAALLKKSEDIQVEEPSSSQKLMLIGNMDYEGMTKFELNLRENAKGLIFTPKDLNKDDIKKFKAYFDFLDSITE